jgi:hypothetical protein
MRNQTTDQEKIRINHISVKGLESKCIKGSQTQQILKSN